MSQQANVIIDKFLGLNMDSTDGLNIATGELSYIKNIKITENYKMRKREGYSSIFTNALNYSIDGMWYGILNNQYRFIFACNGFIYSKNEIKTTAYDTLDTSSYTNVDVIKTTAYSSAIAGTTGIDNKTIVVNKNSVQLSEVTQANIDLVASVNKFYYHTDKTIWFIVAKGTYASIASARTDLSTTTVYYQIGTSAVGKTHFFAFNNKLYMLDGTSYKYWDTTNSFTDVAGYIPKIRTQTPPNGLGGELFEDINVLTGKKHQTFSGNNSDTLYYLAETNVDSIDSVYVDGVLKTLTTDYTVTLATGTVHFVTAQKPPTGVDNVDIYWTKGSGTRTLVTDNRKSILYGGANDSRVFMYGKDNILIHSSLASGTPSVEFFSEANTLLIGSDETDITHLSKQYDRLIIHKETDTYYCSFNYDVNTGVYFTVYPLNDSIGNIAFGQGQTILNNPFVITNNGVFQFSATNVRDEKNAIYASQKVQTGLDELDLSEAITLDWESNYEYWLCVDNQVYIFNYKNKTWYYYELADNPTFFIEIDGQCYFGTSTGKIMQFNDIYLTDNNTTINSRFETGFLNFGANYLRKFLNFGWVGMQPTSKSYCSLSWVTDTVTSSTDYEITYNIIDFGNIDFGEFSFSTNYNPQPFRLKFKAKKWCYFKLIGENNESNKGMTILNVTLPALVGGIVK